MADGTHIEWTDATWNPITGCSIVSPGCANCYAMRLAGTRLKHHPSRRGLTQESKAGPVWNGQVRFNEEWLDQPLRWTRPRRIFVCAHGDLFAEGIPDEWIDRVFAVMALSPQHIFQVLTKRAKRMREYEYIAKPLPNVWLGVSVEDQTRADERIPELLGTPAAIRFISAEPLLGPIDISWFAAPDAPDSAGRYLRDGWLDWVIVGGESGKGARPMHPAWARSLRDQCQAAGVAFFFKQFGEWSPVERHASGLNAEVQRMAGAPSGFWDAETDTIRIGKRAAGRLLDGREWNEVPSQ